MTLRYVSVACGCQGRNPGCVNCLGIGEVKRAACRRCAGTGKTGGSSDCLDCRGDGWRELDQLEAL